MMQDQPQKMVGTISHNCKDCGFCYANYKERPEFINMNLYEKQWRCMVAGILWDTNPIRKYQNGTLVVPAIDGCSNFKTKKEWEKLEKELLEKSRDKILIELEKQHPELKDKIEVYKAEFIKR
jgi:hypothetical protein